jgi:acetyl esterase/lipase
MESLVLNVMQQDELLAALGPSTVFHTYLLPRIVMIGGEEFMPEVRTYGRLLAEDGVGTCHIQAWAWGGHVIYMYLGESMQAAQWVFGSPHAMATLIEVL